MAERIERLNPQKLNKEQNEPSDNSFLKGFSAGKSVSGGKSVVVNKLVIDGTINVLKRAINNATPDNFDKILSVMEKVVALNKGSNVNLDTLSGELEVLETSLPASSNLIAENTRLNRDVLRRSPYAPGVSRGPGRITPFTPIDKTSQADIARIQPPVAPPMAPAMAPPAAPPMAPPTAPPFRPQPPLVDPERQRVAPAAPVREPILADQPPPTNLVESDFDHLTFSQALEVAKESGLETFRWQGELYSTRSSADRASTTAPARQRNMAHGGPVTQNEGERMAATPGVAMLTNLKVPKIKATSPTTQLSEFEKAFEAASSAGLETFKWEGNVFTTDKKATPAQSPQLELELEPQAIAQAAPRVRRGGRRRPQLQPQLQTQPPSSFSGGGLIKRKNYAVGGLVESNEVEGVGTQQRTLNGNGGAPPLVVSLVPDPTTLEDAMAEVVAGQAADAPTEPPQFQDDDEYALVPPPYRAWVDAKEASAPERHQKYEKQIGPLINRLEGVHNSVYPDTKGFITVGIGHLVTDETYDILEERGVPLKVRSDLKDAVTQMKTDVSECGEDNACINNIKKVNFGLSDEHRDLLRDYDIGKKEKVLQGEIPAFDFLPVALQVQLLQSRYRGAIGTNTTRLINQGKWEEAAVEFLRHDEYLDPETSTGIKSRMEDLRDALLNMVGQDDFAPGSSWVRYNSTLGNLVREKELPEIL